MLAEIGFVSVFLAFVAALYAVAAATYSGRIHSERLLLSARNAALATFPLLLIAALALWIALIRGDYQINYVRSVTDPQTPLFYRITALWGSQRGSILFWALLMSVFAFAALLSNWKSDRRLMPGVIAYTMAVLAFFLFLIIFLENPFERVWVRDLPSGEIGIVDSVLIPPDVRAPPEQRLVENSQGLNPLLRHFGMVVHPPMLYLGFVGFTIPFAFAMAALASGDLSTNWIKATRRWTLIAWLFLSLGLLLGGRWAYDVLGWGGYWGWDPVENAAFLPWLLGTAFLHSVMIQEKRGMLKVWNMFLIIGTFSAVIFATFATRSGLVDSVHSFARSSIGMPMFLFWAGITLISVALILWRRSRGELRDEHHNTGLLSRETMFVLNNVIFVALTAAIFWGSFGAPIFSELFLDSEITLGQEYFLQVTPPLFLALFILMGVAPVTAWGATSLARLGRTLLIPLVLTVAFVILLIVTGTSNLVALIGYGFVSMAGFVALYEIWRGAAARIRTHHENPLQATASLFTRNRRRYGGYIVHLGITILGIGVIGSTIFQTERQVTIQRGETIAVNDTYQMRYDNFTEAIAEDGRLMEISQITVFKNGNEVAQLRPRIDNFPDMPMTIAGAHSTLENDFYVLLIGWEEVNYSAATFRVYINPLINLVWLGGLILMLGTIISAWPNETVPARVTKSIPAGIGATA